jgi:hypothetical protein
MTDSRGPGVQSFVLRHDAWGRLVLALGGEEHVSVEVSRAFPITAPQHMVSVCSAEERELLWIEDLGALPASVRGLLEEELGRRDLVPVLRRILRISSVVEPSEWEVETDRGVTTFLLSSDEDVYPLKGGGGRWSPTRTASATSSMTSPRWTPTAVGSWSATCER